ncbi:DNA-binding transcriptional LysR family regulator [Pseudomonas sp. BIGb0408]|uniref:DNA-binding transcriptional LysR family regulator n=1 Tax=Phytopseudomonas flavescens TaxID=29435 RepID=A0A7Y9XNM4_9GAMM|nr:MULTISPECIES: LysR family transcriptional regulator [Pseudomonas]MCW2290788.1 DNA-binding transcriptional LysR family regulator [Pseudomonas sp. BIGb0408]NYH74640.1 DNA-binding transcriptional LysR family regulator [Pseudomonas flavescens]
MISVEDMRLAATLAKAGSLSAAARMLNVTPPALSMRLRKLEAALGAKLANRDAQRLSLTAEGERLAAESVALLERIDGLCETFREPQGQLTGTLRLATSFGYGRKFVAPLLSRFARRHPSLKVHLDLRETPWPDRHDSDAVIHIGAVRDSSWVARTLATNERWLCASPAYLDTHGGPQNPGELAAHRCICIRENEEDATLWHVRRSGVSQTVRIEPTLVCNDGVIARQWAEQGHGLLLRSEWDVRDGIARGTLVRLLEQWSFGSAPIQLLVPIRKDRSARVQALIAFLDGER